MQIEELIKQIREHLTDTDDLSVLSDWDNALSVEFAFIAQQLAVVKRDRAKKEIDLKSVIIMQAGKATEKEVERSYFATEQGQYYAYASEILKGISKLISAVRFKRKILSGDIN